MNFDFKKKYGQNFISDESLIERISTLVSPNEDDLIIEIGPGAGALTSYLVKYNTNYLAYEIDRELDKYLSKYNSDKFNIIYDDFLKRDIKEDIKGINYNNLYIIGNLPYYITTNILMKLIDSNIDITKCVFMVQKEYGDRLTALPGNREYGSITVLLDYFFNIKEEFIVTRDKFKPVPNVDSVIISLTSKEKEEIDINKYKELVKDAFQFKRKTLRNNLKKYDLDAIEQLLNKYNHTLSDRAEEIDYNIYVDIVKTLL